MQTFSWKSCSMGRGGGYGRLIAVIGCKLGVKRGQLEVKRSKRGVKRELADNSFL